MGFASRFVIAVEVAGDHRLDFGDGAWRIERIGLTALNNQAFRVSPDSGPMFLWNLNWQMYDYDIENACSHLRWYGILEHDGAPLNPVGQLENPRATATNPDFLKRGTLFTAPRSVRFGLRLRF